MTGDELRVTLKIMGWSGRELARRLGMHRNTVSSWTTGRIAIPPYVVEYLRVVRLLHEALK